MKVLKKICVFLLVGMIAFTSTALSYQKADTCEAVSVGVGVGIVAAILGVGCLCYGAYYVSQPENQDGVKQALSDYANTTVECAQLQYEMNKKLFNDFCDYAISKAGSNAAVRGADGKKYTIEDMKDEGFPDFEKWDEEMKKQSKKPSGGFGSIWDKMSFGLDLLSFICGFFVDDNGGMGSSDGSIYPQLYFTGDDGYINRETGDVNISLYGISLNSKAIYGEPLDNLYYRNCYMRLYQKNVGERAETYRVYAVLVDTKEKNYHYPSLDEARTEVYSYGVIAQIRTGASNYVLSPSSYYLNKTYDNGDFVTVEGESGLNMSVSSSYSPDLTYKNPYFISTNVPLFSTVAEGVNYINTGDASSALNLPPTITGAPTSTPPERPVTPVSIYCNSFSGKNVTVNDITNVNYYIANNWVTTTNKTENLTTVINNYYDNDTGEPDKDKEESTPTPRPTLTPTENEPSGDTNTYNFFIEIENILSPIKVTVENIYNFFKIDTEQIGSAWQLDYVPSADFQQLVDVFDKMSSAFGSDVYMADVTQSPIYCDGTGTNVDTENGVLVSGSKLVTDYPVISFKCPDILSPYVSTTDSDGNKAIILCDFENYALYFARFRAFINIVLWIGLLFYLMREVKVNFVIH